MALKRLRKQICSSRFLINFLCIREMRSKAKREDVDNAKLELEKETTWSRVMEVLLKAFGNNSPDNLKIAEDVEDILQREFETAVIVRNTRSCKEGEKPEDERNTIVLVQFNDEPGTVMVFRVINKMNILSLRGMAAAKVSRYIQKIEAIENIDALDVPKDVVPDIRRVFSEDLKVSTYSRYLYEKTCCVGCAALHIANHW